MRHHGEEVDAEFMGLEIHALRGLQPDFFQDDWFEDRTQEGDTAVRPLSLPAIEEQSILHHSSHTSQIELPPMPMKALGNEKLPMFGARNEAIEAIVNNQITLIIGGTGTGKSTLTPLFLFDAGIRNICVTQPSRPAAHNVGQRIHGQIAEAYGKEYADKQVRVQTAVHVEGPADAPIQILTDGILLPREMKASKKPLEPIVASKRVEDLRVIMADEVHKQGLNIEFLLAAGLDHVEQDPNARMVLMTATLDKEKIIDWVWRHTGKMPAVIEVAGRQHPIEMREEPTSTVGIETAKAAMDIFKRGEITKDSMNGILVFVPGKREIEDRIDDIYRALPDEVKKHVRISAMHSKLSYEDQQKAIAARDGIRIIVTTDILQESSTVAGIRYVIDSGEHRRKEIDEHFFEALVKTPISQDELHQRAGRAGRLDWGVHILTRAEQGDVFMPLSIRAEHPKPEIYRTDPTRSYLRAMRNGLDMDMIRLVNPVSEGHKANSRKILRTLGAFGETDKILSTMGERMDDFTVKVSSARMMYESERFSADVRRYMAAIVASVEVGGLQYFAHDSERRWKELTDQKQSDLLGQLDFFIRAQEARDPEKRAAIFKEMREFDLDLNNVDRAFEIYEKITRMAGVEASYLNEPTDIHVRDIIFCITAGQFPNTFRHEGGGFYRQLGGPAILRQISNRSIVEGRPNLVVGNPWRVVTVTRDGVTEKHIIEGVTVVQASDIGKVAMHLIEKPFEEYALRDGRYVERRRHRLFDMDLGVVEETIAEPSPKLRETVIAHALEKPGPNQQELRKLKRALEKLDHLSKSPVPRIYQAHLEQIVRDATPEDVDVEYVVDVNIGAIMNERGISLDSIISPEQRARIKRNAPSTIESEGFTFQVGYESHRAIIRSYDPAIIEKLNKDIFLPDGRLVMFTHYFENVEQKRTKKLCTLIELKDELEKKQRRAVESQA